MSDLQDTQYPINYLLMLVNQMLPFISFACITTTKTKNTLAYIMTVNGNVKIVTITIELEKLS